MADVIKYEGTTLGASIVPGTSLDKFATHQSEFGKGGWHEVATVAERDAIPAPRLSNGMAVYVSGEDKLYIYKGDSKWEEFKSGGGAPLPDDFRDVPYIGAEPFDWNNSVMNYDNVTVASGTIGAQQAKINARLYQGVKMIQLLVGSTGYVYAESAVPAQGVIIPNTWYVRVGSVSTVVEPGTIVTMFDSAQWSTVSYEEQFQYLSDTLFVNRITFAQQFDTKQDVLTAGEGISIENNTVSADLPFLYKDAFYDWAGVDFSDSRISRIAEYGRSTVGNMSVSFGRTITSNIAPVSGRSNDLIFFTETDDNSGTIWLYPGSDSASALGVTANTWYKAPCDFVGYIESLTDIKEISASDARKDFTSLNIQAISGMETGYNYLVTPGVMFPRTIENMSDTKQDKSQIAVNGTVTAGGYSIPNPTADELTAIYNAVVAGNSVQIVDKNNVYYQVVLADSMDGAINVEILYFSELAIIYSLEHDVVNIETKSLGGALPDDFTDVKYTSKEAEIDWSNPAWSAVDETVYEENPGYFMTFKTSELVAGNDDNDGFSVAIYDIDEGVDYVMFAPDAIPLNGFSDVKAGVWYKVTGYDDDSLYTGFEEVETAEVNAFFNAIKARGGYIADQDLYDYFTAEILTEKEPVDVTFGEKFAESEVKVKPLLDATETVLESNTIYNGGMLGDIDISLPASLDVTYITQLHFSTPEDAGPTFVYDERIAFFGDDCEGGVFTPIEWARYSIMIFFDGENPIGMVMRI